jgi:hypothetical protein
MRWTALQLAVGTIKPNFQRAVNLSYIVIIVNICVKMGIDGKNYKIRKFRIFNVFRYFRKTGKC